MHRVLALSESLVSMREQLSKAKGVPVYIASCEYRHQTHYRRPGEFEYVQMGALELFLSRWRSVHERREDFGEYGTDSYRSHFYARLEEADFVHLVYPFKSETADPEDRYGFRDFSVVNLSSALNENRAAVRISRHESVPPELVEYVQEGRKGREIRFCVSEPIEFPRHKKQRWHTTIRVEDGPGHVLEAPGQYSGKDVPLFNGVNGMFILDSEPGGCVLCRGASGERRHWAVAQFGQTIYPVMPICKTCLPKAFAEIQEVVNGR